MRYIIPCLLIIMGLTQCKKDSPSQGPATNNIFSVTPDPNYLLDTLTVSSRTTNEIKYGYFFSYDNLNRLTGIKYYQYFSNIPTNNDGTWTFNYQGNNNSPQSMDVHFLDDYRVYFFYNADGSKNRDSLVSSTDQSIRAVRKYQYDSLFNFAVARHYNNGNLKPSLLDSATFKNYNCTGIYSKGMTWTGNTPNTYEWYDNTYPEVDNNPDPLSKMNIFPALFLSPYLHLAYNPRGGLWRGHILMDFIFQNNLRKHRFYDYATSGYNYTYISSGEGETYDSKNRIIQKDFADSAGSSSIIQYRDRFYAIYKYK